MSHRSFYVATWHVRRLAKANRESVGDLECYECRQCGHFHVGHVAKRGDNRGR